MRLFIGIELNQAVKSELGRSIERLKEAAIGNFSPAGNLHITLQFLGEKKKEEIELIVKAMQKASSGFTAFSLYLDNPGKFDRGGESIVWYGVSGETERLNELFKFLCSALYENGVSFDKSAFKPQVFYFE